jgi:hypothetical protein
MAGTSKEKSARSRSSKAAAKARSPKRASGARGSTSRALSLRAGSGAPIMAAAGPMLAAAPKQVIIGIRVKFELNARNGLRRVIFGLEKNTEGDKVFWKINFELLEREKKSDPFGDPLVKLEVGVDTALNAKAEQVAKSGLTTGQGAHAIGPAADDAKAAEAGEIPREEAEGTVQDTLKKK